MPIFKKNKPVSEAEAEAVAVQDFLDHIVPSIIRFYSDHYICGNTYRCVWAIREYPASTEEQAILRFLGGKDGGDTAHLFQPCNAYKAA